MNETGFPSPAQGYEKAAIDLNSLLVKHPASTFIMVYQGKDNPGKGITKGDILVVDSSLPPLRGAVAVVESGGRFLCVTLEEESSLFFRDRAGEVQGSGNRSFSGKSFFYTDTHGGKNYVESVFGIVRAAVRIL